MGSSIDRQQCRGTARRQAQAEHKADVLAEENASLILELNARPTAKQYKSLQRQMDILERRLSESKAETQGYALHCSHSAFKLPCWPPSITCWCITPSASDDNHMLTEQDLPLHACCWCYSNPHNHMLVAHHNVVVLLRY